MSDAQIPFDVLLKTPHRAPVPGAEVTLAGGGVVRRGEEVREGLYHLALGPEGDYQLKIERFGQPGGFDHRTIRQTLFLLRDERGLQLKALQPPGGYGARPRIRRKAGGFSIELEMDYLWFTPIGTPPTLGNQVDLLVDGEEGWAAVAEAIRSGRRSVHVTTWLYQPTTELVRPSPLADPEERERNTVHELLKQQARQGATVRLLLWDAPVLDMPREAREAARDLNDNFEVQQQENPTERSLFNSESLGWLNKVVGQWKIGSYHQKTVIVDGTLGFCGGMNLKENDWDTKGHRLFDPRRARFNRHRTFRERVTRLVEKPDHRPRHDFIARVRGPAVQHLELNFRQRWNHQLQEDGGWAKGATPVPEPAPLVAAGPSQVQVVRTMPAPFDERGILDVHLRALRAARRLIFIEDQYFRSTHVSDAIATAVRKWPELEVIVVTQQVYAEDIVSGGWTQECTERIRARKPDFTLHTLRSAGVDDDGERLLEEIDNHSKLMVVDDLFMTVGSCNINDRGFEYEGEINIAMVDPPRVAEMRRSLWQDLLGPAARLTGDIAGDVAEWKRITALNAAFERGERDAPEGFVYAFKARVERPRIAGRDVT